MDNQVSDTKPLVVILSLVYNHGLYVRDTLEGFVNQKTTFPFIAIVHDDASTDNSANIIREYEKKYPHIIKPIYESENQYSKKDGSLGRIMRKARDESGAKYVAMCEGDDYWTDPYKLQKQVDFLELNPDFGMCYTSFDIKNEVTGKYTKDLFKTLPSYFKKRFCSPEDFVFCKGYVGPMTWVYRSSVAPKTPLKVCDGSFYYFTHFLATTKVYVFDDVTATYRIIKESASHSSNYKKIYEREASILSMQLKLIDKYNLCEELKAKVISEYYNSNLYDFVLHDIRNECSKAKFLMVKKGWKQRILFLMHDLHIGWMLKFRRRVVVSYY